MADHRIAGPLVARAQWQIAVFDRRRDDVVLHQISFELVARGRPATIAEMIGRIALGEEAEHALAILDGGVRLRGHHHTVRNFGRAGRYELGLAFDRNQADATVAHDGQSGVPAERWNLDACLPGCIENGLTVFRC